MTWHAREIRAALRAGISRDRYWNLCPGELWEELDAARCIARRTEANAVLSGWYAGYVGTRAETPSLASILAPYTGQATPAVSREDEEARTAAARVRWNGVFRVIGEQREADEAKRAERDQAG